MEPLICPQCGGQITDYSPGHTFATCSYCSTRFLIESNKQPPPPPVTFTDSELPKFEGFDGSGVNPRAISAIVTVLIISVGVLIFVGIAALKNQSKNGKTTSWPFSTANAKPSPSPTPDLLEFGGQGSESGHFLSASALAVDKYGRIYVGDQTLRLQRFDSAGNFLNAILIPENGANYDNAKWINKVAVADNGDIYVGVGGVVLRYAENSTKPMRTYQVAPDYIQDFVLRSDGTMLMISNNDRVETLNFVSKTGQITRRISGFHTKPAAAVMSPAATGLAAIRMAADHQGNIYSIYALGALGNYTLSYNKDDFRILGFTPDGTFVYKFGQTIDSCGIAVDSMGRFYVSGDHSIRVLNDKGDVLATVPGVGEPTAFALDKDDNVYVLFNNKVIKRAAVRL